MRELIKTLVVVIIASMAIALVCWVGETMVKHMESQYEKENTKTTSKPR
jgi:hypothetical protein